MHDPRVLPWLAHLRSAWHRGVQGFAGDAVEEGEELTVVWSLTNTGVELEWYSTEPIWISRTSRDGAVSRQLHAGGRDSFANARELILEPDTDGMLFLARIRYCLVP